MESLANWYRYHKREILFLLIIFVVATLSFGLGYLANQEWNRIPIVIEKSEQ